MFGKNIYSFIAFILTSNLCCSQDFTFTQFGQNEGLAHVQVLDIAQDLNGNLWMGTTTQAIYRFDGRHFYQYKISIPEYTGSIITFKILADELNTIWIMTNQGLIKFDGLLSRRIPQKGNPVVETGSKLFIDKNKRLWFIDNKGFVFEMKNDTLSQRLDIEESLGGKVIGHYYDNNILCFFSLKRNVVRVDQSGKINQQLFRWPTESALLGVFRTQDSDILALQGKVEEIKANNRIQVLLPENVNKHFIRQVIKDKMGLIWVLVANKIFVIDKENILHQLSGTSALSGNYSNCLFKDNNGDVWISIDGVGILKYKKYSWRKLPLTIEKNITTILELPGSHDLLFGTYSNGIIGWGDPLIKENPITSLSAINDRSVLVGTLEGGLYKVFKNSATRLSLSNSEIEYVHGVAVDRNKYIAGSHVGLFVIDGNRKVNFRKRVNGRDAPITNPIVSNDQIYFAGMSAGLMKIAGDSVINIGPEFLEKSTIYNIKKLKWGGFVVTGEFSKILFFDKDFKLQYSIDLKAYVDNVLIVEFLDKSTVIIGSNDGLFKMVFEGKDIKSVKKYGKADGYAGEEMYGGSSIVRSNAEVLIGTVDGAYVFNPKNEEINTSPTMVYMTGINWINDETRINSEGITGYFQIPINPEFSHNQNSITFSFDYSNLNNPNNIKFHHQLLGLENEWSPASTTQQVTFSNLSPGHYTFNIQAISEGKVYGAIQQYHFTIVPAFWQLPIFYLFIFIGMLVVMVLITQIISNYKVKQHKLEIQIRADESVRIRKHMSMDFHDEMGNKLAGMLAQASMLKHKHRDGELVSVFDYFEKNAYAIYHGTKDFIWTIDVNSNNLKEVISYLRDFGVQFFERHDISFNVEDNILDDVFDYQLPDGYNRQIILIFKEAMTNALKHARCNNVYFSAISSNNQFEITFADDGKWQSESLRGNGLRNMHQRANKIKSMLSINNQNGKTIISLIFKT